MNSINCEIKVVLASVFKAKIWRYLDLIWLKKEEDKEEKEAVLTVSDLFNVHDLIY